jgi:hypothetical protein
MEIQVVASDRKQMPFWLTHYRQICRALKVDLQVIGRCNYKKESYCAALILDTSWIDPLTMKEVKRRFYPLFFVSDYRSISDLKPVLFALMAEYTVLELSPDCKYHRPIPKFIEF